LSNGVAGTLFANHVIKRQDFTNKSTRVCSTISRVKLFQSWLEGFKSRNNSCAIDCHINITRNPREIIINQYNLFVVLKKHLATGKTYGTKRDKTWIIILFVCNPIVIGSDKLKSFVIHIRQNEYELSSIPYQHNLRRGYLQRMARLTKQINASDEQTHYVIKMYFGYNNKLY
jgi:hypothetical protein